MKRILLAVMLFAGSFCFSNPDLDKALVLSKQDGKPVLIDFYAVWCGPCKKFNRESKSDADLKKALGKVHLVKIDAEKGDGVQLAKKFEVSGYPTYVLSDAAMRPIHRWVGYEKSFFLEEFSKGLSSGISIEERTARFEKEENLEDAKVLGEFYASKGQTEKALNFFKTANKLSDDHRAFDFQIFQTQAQTFFRGKKDGFDQLNAMAKDLVKSKISPLPVSETMSVLSKAFNDQESFKFYAQKAIDLLEADDKIERRDFRLNRHKSTYAMYIDKDNAAGVKYYAASMPNGWKKSPEQINEFSWWCFENKVNHQEARDLAEKAVAMSKGTKSEAMIIDTQAELENALGFPSKAAKLMERAINIDPKDDYWQKQLTRFKKIAADKKAQQKS